MDELPDEMVLSVFEFLPANTLLHIVYVSKRWLALARHPSLWRVLDFNVSPLTEVQFDKALNGLLLFASPVCVFTTRHKAKQEHVKRLAQCPLLKTLSIPHCPEETFAGFGGLSESWPDLETLSLRGCQLPKGTLPMVAQHCTKLQELDLHRSNVKNEDLYEVFQFLPHLKIIDMYGAGDVTSETIKVLASTTTSLVELNLHGCTLVSDEAVIPVVENNTSMEILNVHRCTTLTDPSLFAIAEHLPLLKKINMHGCSLLTDEGVITLVKACRSLTFLNLGNCRKITDAAVEAAAGCLPSLQYFNIHKCWLVGDAGVTRVAASCPLMEEFNLGGCQITVAALDALEKSCPRLHTANTNKCAGLTEEQIGNFERVLNVRAASVPHEDKGDDE